MFLFYYFYGMNFIWWFLWILFLIWIFATPWGYRRARDTSYDILRKRFAAGEITKEEYLEAKKVLEQDFQKIVRENK